MRADTALNTGSAGTVGAAQGAVQGAAQEETPEPLALRLADRLASAPTARAELQVPPAHPVPMSPMQEAGIWAIGGFVIFGALGWLFERRLQRRHAADRAAALLARPRRTRPPETIAAGLDRILPDGPDPAEAARAIYVTGIGDTLSRREATLAELHHLYGKLQRRRRRKDTVAAVLLLQQHLTDFRYTSPWLFLELLELYRQLDLREEWEVARDAFRKRFGQNAPPWSSPSTVHASLADDPQLALEVARRWPFQAARMGFVRWILGEHAQRQRNIGPPLLPLGIYRDMMLLDGLLDEVMQPRSPNAPSLE